MKHEQLKITGVGVLVGIIAVLLVYLGNPANMGFCIACFIRDTAGGLGLHNAKVVQYIRPEISGLILGAFAAAFLNREFAPRGGSAPLTRFILGFCAMVGCLMFLGCPLRMLLRIAGGDVNGLIGLLGFAAGIMAGIYFLNRGYSLKRTYKQSSAEAMLMPFAACLLLLLVVMAPVFVHFSTAGPGSSHAPVIYSLAAGLAVGALAQRSRFCMVAGLRDFLLFRETKMLLGFVALVVAALLCNAILGAITGAGYIKIGLTGQPIAHNDVLWNVLGLFLAGYACVLLGGCPLRQLILSGEGNSDSSITLLGFLLGAACCHNFGLASSGAGPTVNGQIAVVLCLVVVTIIAWANTFRK